MLVTTLNNIKKYNPCGSGWKMLLNNLGKTKSDDEPLAFLIILESNGFYDAIWCMRSAPEYEKEWRLFAVWCARQVQHLMTDERSIAALDVAEKYINGEATKDELNAACDAARAAAWDAAWDAACSAAMAAACSAAMAAARDASWDAAWDAARDAAMAAAWAAARDAACAAACDAAWDAAWDAACAAAREAQKVQFIKIISGE